VYEKAPSWLRDNEYIVKGYRIARGWKNSLRSLCSLHNETMNVWTHLLGSMLMVTLLVVTMISLSPYGVDRILAIKESFLLKTPGLVPLFSASSLASAGSGVAASAGAGTVKSVADVSPPGSASVLPDPATISGSTNSNTVSNQPSSPSPLSGSATSPAAAIAGGSTTAPSNERAESGAPSTDSVAEHFTVSDCTQCDGLVCTRVCCLRYC